MDVSRRRQLLADGVLVLNTLVWGSTFALVKDVVAQVPPMLFLAARFMLAALALGLILTAARRWRGLSMQEVKWGTLLGLFLGVGFTFQTVGIQWTTASNAGFITGLGVVLVPVLGLFVLRKSPDRWAWVGVVFATAGLALLSLHFEAGLSINAGDPVVLGCAFAFALHILFVSKVAWHTDPLRLTFVQMVVAGLLNAVAAGLFEGPIPHMGGEIWLAAAFLGLVASALATWAQVVVQRFTTAVHTALIFTLEPVFAAIFSVWLQGDRLGAASLAGGGLILLGMVLAEIGAQAGDFVVKRLGNNKANRRGAVEQGSHAGTDLHA